jgi:hypothetical protein
VSFASHVDGPQTASQTDAGSGDTILVRRAKVLITHKAIICYKSLVEKKPTSQVAQETFHSPEDVEHYVQCFRRIQLCCDKGLSQDEIAQATGHSLGLVREYLELIDEFRIPPLPDPERKEDSHHNKQRKQRGG